MRPLRSLVLSALLLAGAALPSCGARPPVITAETRCGSDQSCPNGDEECAQSQLNEELRCEIGRARSIAAHLGPREAFDSLARFHLPREVRERTSGEAREEAVRALEEWYPAVRAEILDAMAARRYVLAARRYHFVAAASPLEFLERLPNDGVIERAVQFHQAEARRLATTLPAAALFHRCALSTDTCPGKDDNARHDISVLAHTADLSFTMKAMPGCERAAAQGIYPEARSVGAVRTAHVAVHLTQCGALPDVVTKTQIPCQPRDPSAPRYAPSQTPQVGVTKRVRRYHIGGRVEVDGAPRPIDATAEVETFEGVPAACAPPSPPVFDAEALAARSVTEAVGRAVGDARHVEPAEHVRAAEAAVAAGDRDRADHFYELACIAGDAVHKGESAREAAQRWFADRYGLLGPRYDHGVDFAPSPIGLAATRTFVRDCALH